MKQEQFSGSQLSQRQVRAQQIFLLAQMMQFAAQARHVDELFLWLSQNIVHGFSVPAVQMWLHLSRSPEDTFVELHANVFNDPTLPSSLVTKQHVVDVTRTIQRGQRGQPKMQVQPVDFVLPPHQATLLKRYGLTYLSTSFLCGNVLLPSAKSAEKQLEPAIPLAITVLLFLRQIPSDSLVSAVTSLLEQLLPVASNHGLLLSASEPPYPIQAALSLSQLIACRVRNNAQNPLSEATNISDKRTRRFYAAVDGRKTIAELTTLLHMDTKETRDALHALLDQNLIQLYDRNGSNVGNSHIL